MRPSAPGRTPSGRARTGRTPNTRSAHPPDKPDQAAKRQGGGRPAIQPGAPPPLPVPGLLKTLSGLLDLGLGGRAAGPVGALNRLAGLKILVNLEEVLDLQPVKLRQVINLTQVLGAGVARGDAEDLVVGSHLVGHPEHADHPPGDQAPGKCRLLKQHEGVQRIAVSAKGVLDEPVIGRVPGRGEQHAVKADPAGVVVDLVLVPLPFGDLNDHFDVHVYSTRRLLIYSIVATRPAVTGRRVRRGGDAALSYAHRRPRKVSTCAAAGSRPWPRSRC